MSACVTLEEVVAAAQARSASLVPETSGYLALAVSDATSRLPLRLDDRAVLLTTEGTVTVRTRGEAVAPAEAARLLRDLLARLLAASAGSMPNLTATARPRPAHEQDPEAVARELEAALIPVNRNAARRALARLARETLRAKEAGRLRRPRPEVQAKPAAPEAEEMQPPPQAEHARRDATAAAPRSDAPAAPRSGAPAAPLQHPIVELTLSPGPIAPVIVELTLSPGLVACATSGAALPAPASAGDGAAAVAVEPCPDVATAPARASQQAEAPERASHASEHVEALPEPTPTIVQAVVELDVAPAPAEIPIIPELVEPARSIAPVAPIARAAVEIAPEGARPVPAPSLVACGPSACSEALTSPEGLEVLLVDFSPGPAAVALSSREPTPTASILVEFSPEPADVVPLSQEPTPTVATAVWEEREAAGEAVLSRVAEAPAGATDVPEPIETSRAPAIHFMAPDAALQVTPAYGAWPLVRRADLAVPAGPRAAVAPFEETPAARHTLPWPVPARCDDDAPAAPIPTALAAPVEALLTTDADGPETAHAGTPAEDEAPEQPPAVLAPEELPADAAAPEEPPAVLAPEELPADATASEEPPAVLAPEELSADAAPEESPAALAPEQPPTDTAPADAASEETPADAASEEPPAALAPEKTLADAAPEETPADAASEEPPAALASEQTPADAAPADTAPEEPPADPAPTETPCPAELGPIDAIVWNASRRSRSARPPVEGVDAGASRVYELVARFVAQSEQSTQRRAARSMKVLAGLDLTRTPPPVAAVSATSALAVAGARPPLAGAQRPVAPELAPPESAHVVPTDAGSRPPVPLVAPRRRGLSLWLALLALALLCAGLAGTLRPDVFASLTEPLARGAL
ncbi:hypothetical protein [Sorangium atrum]|uniref:Uncharacterized protein n=1 Tax=Sorangium atrum TaxID=2995308 RepID=A0ABT5BV92_9BACT|nr:hypothetical protein [Sorangium aterium]MDC0678054.1 hypothetical protein [Sorangium aterium]